MRTSPIIVIIFFTVLCNSYYGMIPSIADMECSLSSSGFVIRNQEVSLDGFTFRSIYSENPLVISHIGDIDDDSNNDLIGFNSTHKFKINYNVTKGVFDRNPILNNSELYLPRNLGFIDFNGDNRLEAMGSNLSLYQWENNTFEMIKTNNVSGSFVPSYGDIDSDGDIDIINYGRPDGFYFIKNHNYGSFQYDISDRNGLPEFTGHPSREYLAMSYMFEDLNNDGWLDVCTGMGDRYEMYPGQDYFWISNGDGTWTEFSDGCPTWDYGLDIDSADFDKDGDQDFLINLKHNKTTVFQNNYPDPWM
ncbi:MAG: VCBS repeat-containing protein, partial [Thermoplasmata archaeon]|nr:VCBS repeat-containing protein [Thermoplasmata archaeon]